MAVWEIYEKAGGDLGVNYRNRTTGQVSSCGVLRRETPAALLVSWVVNRGEAAPFDLIALPSGAWLQVQAPLVEPEVRFVPENITTTWRWIC